MTHLYELPLSVQDQFNGSSKVADLKDAIGKQETFRQSSTGWAELVSVSEDGNTCYWSEINNKFSTKFMYDQYGDKPSAIIHDELSYISWNKLFF